MKHIHHILFFSILFGFTNSSAQSQLDLKLFLFNPELKPLDPIISVIRIENLGENALTLNYLQPELYNTALFQIRTQGESAWKNVKSIKENDNLERLSNGFFTKYRLAAHTINYRLNNFIGVSPAYGKSTLEDLDWKPGNYELRVLYRYNEKMDSIVSNVVKFRVLSFEGSELKYYNIIKSNPNALVLAKPFFSIYSPLNKEQLDTPFLTQNIDEMYFKELRDWYILTVKNTKAICAFGSKQESAKFDFEQTLKNDINPYILNEPYNRVLAQLALIRKIYYVEVDEENFNQDLLDSILNDLKIYPQLNNEYIANLLSKYKKN